MVDPINLGPVHLGPANLRLALLSAAVLGFRHGLDYDHIAAITDISSVQLKARDAMRYGLLRRGARDHGGHPGLGRGGVPHRAASGQ